MSAPAWLALIVASLLASARIRLSAVIFGQPVSLPVLGLVAIVMVLMLAAVVLFLLRSLLREGLRLRAGAVSSRWPPAA